LEQRRGFGCPACTNMTEQLFQNQVYWKVYDRCNHNNNNNRIWKEERITEIIELRLSKQNGAK
jgi:hypothetical protein